jgi:hypothetical protein
MRVRRVLPVVAAAFLVTGVVYHFAMRGIVIRSSQVDAHASQYAGDFGPAATRLKVGFAASPDGRFVAFDTNAARSYHTICVWDRWTEQITPALSVQEIDPGSGTSHNLAWSVDSHALLISGRGKLPFRTPGKLCFVYLPERAVLQEVSSCG